MYVKSENCMITFLVYYATMILWFGASNHFVMNINCLINKSIGFVWSESIYSTLHDVCTNLAITRVVVRVPNWALVWWTISVWLGDLQFPQFVWQTDDTRFGYSLKLKSKLNIFIFFKIILTGLVGWFSN